MVTLLKNNQTAINHVSDFINGQWLENNDGGFNYRNIDYDSINRSEYRRFCLKEQENVCCYCGREIADNNFTELEHIIPRSVTTIEGLQPYFALSSILSNNIVLQESFRQSTTQQTLPPFPHHIAYHNIVASCNGKTIQSSENLTCCNRHRKDDFIPPFNLMPKCVGYANDGNVYYIYDENDNQYINPLNLNKVLLKHIRRIWFLFSRSDVNEQDLAQVNNEASILEVITLHLEVNPFKELIDRNIIDSFKTLSNWNTLMKYRYFLNYFRINNP